MLPFPTVSWSSRSLVPTSRPGLSYRPLLNMELRPVLEGITAGRKPTVTARSLARIATTRTPDF
ncbi:hypothetical protein BGZ97_008458, partial [Linnemannia gamsii]